MIYQYNQVISNHIKNDFDVVILCKETFTLYDLLKIVGIYDNPINKVDPEFMKQIDDFIEVNGLRDLINRTRHSKMKCNEGYSNFQP